MTAQTSPRAPRVPLLADLRSWLPIVLLLAAQGLAGLLVWRGPRQEALYLILTLVAVVAVFALTVARPGPWVLTTLVVLPVQTVLLARAFKSGVPAGALDNAGTWKELVLVAAVIGLLSLPRGEHRTDDIDRVALALIALAGAYLVLGAWQPGLFPEAPGNAEVLARSFRTNVAFVILFLVVRRLPWTISFDRIARVVVVMGVVVAAGAMLEYLANDVWRDFVRDWAGVDEYARGALGSTRGGSVRVAVHDGSGGSTIRAGSFLFSPLTAGFFMLPSFGLALHRFVRRPSPWPAVAAGVIGAGVLMTGTRSAALGAAVTAMGVLISLPNPWLRERGRATVITAAVIIAGLVLASMTGVGARFSSAITGDDPSAEGHRERLAEGFESMLAHPLGKGLASGPTVGGADLDESTVISENAYIQVGNELGFVGMILFIVLVIMLLVALFRRARAPTATPLEGGAAAAGLGLAVGGMFLHVWTSIPTAWTFWLVAGLALAPRASASAPPPDEPGATPDLVPLHDREPTL